MNLSLREDLGTPDIYQTEPQKIKIIPFTHTQIHIYRGINKFPQGVTQPKDRGGPISLSVLNVDIYQTEQQKIKIILFTRTQIHTCLRAVADILF